MRREPPVDLKPYFLVFDDLSGTIDWADFFGNGHRVEIDVGSGRGLFLVNAALDNPRTNYLGIELDYAEGRRGARRIKKRELPNARVLGGDARVALERILPPSSVSAIHVYFPDPWWKRKHRSRRIFTDKFVELMCRVLEPGGIVHARTDVEDYFQVISALMDNHALFERLPAPREQAPQNDMDYRTSFERKGRQAGSTIFRGTWRFAGNR